MAARRRKSRTGTWRWTTPSGRKRTRRTGRQPEAKAAEPVKQKAGRRDLRPEERHVNWTDLEQRWSQARDALVAEWIAVRDRQIDELRQAVEDADGDLGRLAALAVGATSRDARVIADRLRELAEYGAATVRAEAAAQGASLSAPDVSAAVAQLDVRAAAVADLLARSISEVAGRRAVERTGSEALQPAEVATQVGEHLRGLSNAYLEEQLGGALTQGMNTGRRVAMGGAPAGARFFGSALLDTSVCGPCREDDGHEFESLLDAERTYPVGGNRDCKGGVRCRCTIVMQLPESAASVQ